MRAIKAVLIGVFVIAAVVLALALSCPDEDSFHRWVKKATARETKSVVEQAAGALLSTQASWTADYEDHVLWATVEAYQGSDERRYLGIMGMWLELDER